MESNSVCNHTSGNKIGLPRRGSPICLPRVWLQTELADTKSYYQLIIKITIFEKRKKLSYVKTGKFALKTDKGCINCLMSDWNWLQSKWIYWLLSDERKTSLMSIKDATMHEKRTTTQNNLSDFVKISANKAVFLATYNVFTLSRSTSHFKLNTNQSQSQ